MSFATGAVEIDHAPHLVAADYDGCEVAEHCLECPLPMCKYDDPKWWKAYQRERRYELMRLMAERLQRERCKGYVARTARAFGVSNKTVCRAIAGAA